MPNKTFSVSALFEFDRTAPTVAQLSSIFGGDWPTVYIINNEEAYIGETTGIAVRLSQHLENSLRKKLQTVRLISGETFNKSVALDLEPFLISHMAADNKFLLQNGNNGQQKHNYYQKTEYEAQFQEVWHQLQGLGLANKDTKEIENSNLFKYSPYKTLTTDQATIINSIINSLAEAPDQNSTFIVKGGPGTGKTILGIYLLKLLISNADNDDTYDDNITLINNLQRLRQGQLNFKVGIVISMSNLRNIVQEVFANTHNLSANMVYSPNQVAHSSTEFDLLIVDEAHRLRRRKNLSQFSLHDKANRALGLDKDSTELDWILRKSKHQVFLYDQQQSVRLSDVEPSEFTKLANQSNCRFFQLITQVRCSLGGQEYINYVKDIFCNPTKQPSLGLFLTMILGFLITLQKWLPPSKIEINAMGYAARLRAMRGHGILRTDFTHHQRILLKRGRTLTKVYMISILMVIGLFGT